ncbi:hypothetical protein [Microbispora catharanthi]|uniref:hypothetical protein n=1 Tax=Microbispora catharanthi TaxID=1712871 RepID=UPI00197BA54A|nr:hypothetical protein [Microbispora catharanthi]
MRTGFLVVCLPPLLLVTAAACTNAADGKGVASVDGSTRPSASQSLSRMDQFLRYSQCMRKEGVPMTDPEVEGDNVRAGTYDKDSVDMRKVAAAEEACKQYRPPRETGPGMALKDELARRFARCMREQGVEKFPDPNPDGPTQTGPEVGQDPQYREARKTCDAQIDAASASLRPSPS